MVRTRMIISYTSSPNTASRDVYATVPLAVSGLKSSPSTPHTLPNPHPTQRQQRAVVHRLEPFCQSLRRPEDRAQVHVCGTEGAVVLGGKQGSHLGGGVRLADRHVLDECRTGALCGLGGDG